MAIAIMASLRFVRTMQDDAPRETQIGETTGEGGFAREGGDGGGGGYALHI